MGENGRMVGNASLDRTPKIDPSLGAFDFILFVTSSIFSLPFSFRLLGFSAFGFEGLGALCHKTRLTSLSVCIPVCVCSHCAVALSLAEVLSRFSPFSLRNVA